MKKAKIFFFFSLTLLLLFTGFVFWKFTPSLKEFFSEKLFDRPSYNESESRTFDVKVNLSNLKTSKELTSQGGRMELKGEKNIISLNFPKNALLETDVIAMRGIGSISGLEKGWSFIAGVQISPDGKQLGRPGELEMNIPRDISKEKVVGFSYSQEGKEFYLYPLEIKGEKAILKLNGFSGYGLMTMEDPSKTPPEPSQMQKRTKQAIALIMMGGRTKSGGLDESHKSGIWNLLDLWYRLTIKPQLEAAGADENMIIRAVHEYLAWQSVVDGFFTTEFAAEEKEAALLGNKAILNAKGKFSQKCLNQKDALQAGKLYWLYKLSLLMPSGWGDQYSEAIKKDVISCAKFEVKMSSFTLYESCWTTDVSGDGYLGMDSVFNISGNLKLKLNKHDFCGQLCYQTGPEVYDIELPAINFSLGDKNELALLLKFGESPAIDQICPPSGDKKVSVTLGGSAWDGWFADLHSDEIVWLNRVTDEGIFRIPDWEIVNSNGIFARKVYDRTKKQTAGPKPVTEKTIIELIHKPGK